MKGKKDIIALDYKIIEINLLKSQHGTHRTKLSPTLTPTLVGICWYRNQNVQLAPFQPTGKVQTSLNSAKLCKLK